MNDPQFPDEPFTQREAWCWLIENAAWKDTTVFVSGERLELKRGQLIFSQRFLAEKWKWGRQKVRTFQMRLEKCEKVTHDITHGTTILTICNYEKYQDAQPTDKPKAQPADNPAITQQQPKEGRKKERKKDISPDFDRWWSLYPRKVEKVATRKAFEKALGLATLEELCAGAERYGRAVAGKDAEYIKFPATWLNKGCWADEVPQPTFALVRDRMPSPAGG